MNLLGCYFMLPWLFHGFLQTGDYISQTASIDVICHDVQKFFFLSRSSESQDIWMTKVEKINKNMQNQR